VIGRLQRQRGEERSVVDAVVRGVVGVGSAVPRRQESYIVR
jgi:hypothetical protein